MKSVFFVIVASLILVQSNVQAQEEPALLIGTPAEMKRLKGVSQEDLLKELEVRGNNVMLWHALKENIKLSGLSTNLLLKKLHQDQRASYGDDDRRDVYGKGDGIPPLASRLKPGIPDTRMRNTYCVAALIKKEYVERNVDGSIRLKGYKDLIEEYGVCDEENFATQPCVSYCTGFGIASDILASAAHCIKNIDDLDNFYVVFGYKMIDSFKPKLTYAAEDVYKLTEILERRYDTNANEDFLLLRLDKPLPPSRVVQLSTRANIPMGEQVYVIGHPSGLPMKIAGNAYVRENKHRRYFVANLDTYGGSSGSPVLNAKDDTLEGILVRGKTDFRMSAFCRVSLVCPDNGCMGEHVTRVSEFLPYLKKHMHNP